MESVEQQHEGRIKRKKKAFVIMSVVAVLVFCVALFYLIFSPEEPVNTIKSFPERAEVPVLKTTDVVTMISDSGITRYRISAAEWLIYDKALKPYWDFPKGVLFERFDGNLQTDATIKSDEAVFYEKEKLWELTGHVKATNLEDEVFESPKLYWSQAGERIYSSDSITITKADGTTIKGVGFESNQTLSQYSILAVSGFFPVNEE